MKSGHALSRVTGIRGDIEYAQFGARIGRVLGRLEIDDYLFPCDVAW